MKHFGILLLAGMVVLLLVDSLFAQWEPDVRLTYDDSTSHTSYTNAKCVAANGDIVHVVWDDNRDGNYEIYYKSSPDGGTSWGSDTRLTDDPAYSELASVAVFESNIHVVWRDMRDGSREIYYKRSTDGGITWSGDVRLTNNTGISFSPSVSVSGSIVHVVWDDNRDGNYEIYYKRSPDAGISWGTDTRLTNDTANSNYASTAASISNIHVVWLDDRDGNYEIYYKSSPDAGISWGTDTRLTNDAAVSRYASAAVSGTNVHVVWFDERDGNPEIYYKRNPTGNAGIEEQTDTGSKTADIRLVCYPNPFTSAVRVKYAEISEKQKTNLEIYDVRGRLVKSVQLTTNQISLGTDLLPGIYFLKADGKYVGKVVKVR